MSGYRPYDPNSSPNPDARLITGNYQILPTDARYIISDGGNTITFPLFASATEYFFVVNEGAVNDTLNGNGSTVPNGTSLTPSQVRGFVPGTTDWQEI